jgi:hypothetical protein
VLKIIGNYLRNYMSNHRHVGNRVLHVAGVPLAPWGGLVLLVTGNFAWALLAFVLGYGLQWIGHRIEGNEMGDWVLAKQIGLQLVGKRR